MNMKKLTLLFILLSSLISFSQLSNKHWIPPLHCRVASNISEQYIYMSTNETTPFQVKATDGAGVEYIGSPFTISASAPKFFYVGLKTFACLPSAFSRKDKHQSSMYIED